MPLQRRCRNTTYDGPCEHRTPAEKGVRDAASMCMCVCVCSFGKGHIWKSGKERVEKAQEITSLTSGFLSWPGDTY